MIALPARKNTQVGVANHGMTSVSKQTYVIVGASLAGAKAAEELSEEGSLPLTI